MSITAFQKLVTVSLFFFLGGGDSIVLTNSVVKDGV